MRVWALPPQPHGGLQASRWDRPCLSKEPLSPWSPATCVLTCSQNELPFSSHLFQKPRVDRGLRSIVHLAQGLVYCRVCVLRAAESAATPGDPVNEWHPVSCPQQPCSAPGDSACGFSTEPVHLVSVLPLFLRPPIFPSILVFAREPCALIM